MKNDSLSPLWKAFDARKELKQFGSNAIALFALQLGMSIDEDITLVAANSIVDGSDDKKSDLIFIDTERKIALIAQSYFSKDSSKKEAKANKACDLNGAISWLLSGEIVDIPVHLRPHAKELRRVVSNGEIEKLHIWYVHNLPSSNNVKKELKQVEKTAKAFIKSDFEGESSISVEALEVGADKLEEWYKSSSTPILVADKFEIEISDGYEIKQPNWRVFITSIHGKWLYEQFKKYEKSFFSANVRDYLGSRKSDKNINEGMKITAKKSPENFLVFNNGITILTNKFIKITKKGRTFLVIEGASVINGAQTTGTLGHLGAAPTKNLKVQARFVVCGDQKTVRDIVNFNNSQNKINPSDFRSSDPTQTRLEKEFEKIPNISYSPRRGGSEDIIKRRPNFLSSVTAGQVLAGFHGDPGVAYHEKTHIWEDEALYCKYFNDQISAGHINLAYSLVKAIQDKKFFLIKKNKETPLTQQEKKQLEYYRSRGSIIMMETAIASCMEIILDRVIPNKSRLTFSKNISPQDGSIIFRTIVDIASSFSEQLLGGLSDGFKNKKSVEDAIKIFGDLVSSTKEANGKIFSDFSKHIDLK